MTQGRWGIALAGEDLDILDWRETLKAPFDPWVEEHDVQGKVQVLFSERFDSANSAEEAREIAGSLVSEMNGAMAIWRGSRALNVAAVIDFSAPTPRRHIFAKAEGGSFRIRSSSAGFTTSADGIRVPKSPPQPSAPQEWVRRAERTDGVADLLAHASRSDNWFDVYKVIEAAAAIVGGEHKLTPLSPGSKDAKTTANFHRHHKAHKPDPLMSFSDAKAHAFHAAQAALSAVGDETIPTQ